MSGSASKSRVLATVTSREGGGVYAIHDTTHQVNRLFEGPVRGITGSPHGTYFLQESGRVYRLGPGDQAIDVADIGLRGCHDLRWHDGCFYAVACIGNRVVRFSPEFQRLDEIQIVPDERDVAHANCLTFREDECLLSIFTLSPGSREEKRHSSSWRTEGKVLRLDWTSHTFEVVHEPLSQPHSLVWRDGFLHVCESHTSRVLRLRPGGTGSDTVAQLRGFTRGLAMDDGGFWVGISRRRSRERSALRRWWLTVTGWCGVVRVDGKTGRVVARIPLPGTEVYDLLAAPITD